MPYLRGHRRWALPALLLLVALAGCQSRAPLSAGMPGEAQVPAVPFFPQDDYQCGPAALATVLGSAGVAAAPQALVAEVWLPQRQGSLAMELVAAARARERLVYPVTTPSALMANLDVGYPVLVLQNLALSFYPRWHFAVVTGYRRDGASVILNTDTREAEPMRWNRFVRTWQRADQQGWVVLPVGELPPQTRPVLLVQALEELAGTAGAAAAAPYWHATAQRYPDDYLVQFALGNHLWARQQSAAAIEAWRTATVLRPQAFAAWNNLALALAALGCDTADALRGARHSEHAPQALAALERRLAATATTVAASTAAASATATNTTACR